MFKYLVKHPIQGLFLTIITFNFLLALSISIWMTFGFWICIFSWIVIGVAFELLSKRYVLPKLHQAKAEILQEELNTTPTNN